MDANSMFFGFKFPVMTDHEQGLVERGWCPVCCETRHKLTKLPENDFFRSSQCEHCKHIFLLTPIKPEEMTQFLTNQRRRK
jgi:hypothetical protein